jgi:hypothetical protein
MQLSVSSSPVLDNPKKSRIQRRDLCSTDLESRALSDRFKNRGQTVSKDIELQHTLRDDSTLTLGFKWRVIARLKLGGGRLLTPLMMIQQCSSSSRAPVTLARRFAIPPLIITFSL